MSTGILTILGAAYGRLDVTAQVSALVNRAASPQSLRVVADNQTFGDGWPGQAKSLTVVYQYDDQGACTAVVPENTPLALALALAGPPAHGAQAPLLQASPAASALVVWGCSFGLADVTAAVTSMIGPGQELAFTANDATLGDGWPTVVKTCVLVAGYGGVPGVTIVVEGGQVAMQLPHMAVQRILTWDDTVFCLDAQGTVWSGDGAHNWAVVPALAGTLDMAVGAGGLWCVVAAGPGAGDQPLCWTASSSQAPQPVGVNGSRVFAAPDGEAWLRTAGGALLRYDARTKAWLPRAVQLAELAVVGADLQWGLDGKGNILRRNDEGDAWLPVCGSPAGTVLTRITASADGSLYGVADGSAYLYTGGTAQPWLPFGNADIPVRALAMRDLAHAWCITADGLPYFIGSLEDKTEVDVAATRIPLRWDTESVFDESRSTHLYIVNRAAQLVATDPQVGAQLAPLLQAMAGPPPASQAFRAGMCQGLYDADFLSAFNNPNFIGQATWASHFYDPDTGLNWRGDAAPTALGNGVGFFQAAVETMSAAAPDLRKAGYQLGLALHYFTDLSQPMHAANYTYLSSWPFGYHSDFEVYAMSVQAALAPQPVVTGFQPGAIADVGQLYRQTAINAKRRYLDDVIAAHRYLSWKYWPQQWQAAVGKLLPAMLNDAVGQTAQLLYLWALACGLHQAQPVQEAAPAR